MATDIGDYTRPDREYRSFRISAGTIVKNTHAVETTDALENNESGQPIYIGKAEPGSSKGAAVWQIQKITYDGMFITDIKWASGNSFWDKVWDDKESYVYS